MRERYALFAMDTYYPHGGAEDFRGWHDTVEEAKSDLEAHVEPTPGNGAVRAHITDTDLEIVVVGRIDARRGYDRARWIWEKPGVLDGPLGWDEMLWGGT